jgi:hypothetical protein
MEDLLVYRLDLVVSARDLTLMASRLRTKCGHLHSPNNLRSTAFQAIVPIGLNSHLILNNHPTKRLHNLVIQAVTRRYSRLCSIKAYKGQVKAIQQRDEGFTNLIKTPSNSCNRVLPVLSQALRTGLHNCLQGLVGDGEDSRSDNVHENVSMITSYEIEEGL